MPAIDEQLKKFDHVVQFSPSQSNDSAIPAEITEWAQARVQAKKDKNYQLADELRDKVTQAGYSIEDKPGGEFRIKAK